MQSFKHLESLFETLEEKIKNIRLLYESIAGKLDKYHEEI